ncbi:MAG TPA: sensor domain-containing diguanylate cyclase [Thermoanaerobaculia bacterium]|nr:sensor domain-containing diguanylate cyclase [Thermoanaerobaculia bacterium]HUM29308.1 sensor domain-containing diguanylate cyclase [Thermoanaerobaculia bacterium]HXK67734.1 sensor domain-containing diguanylate cyclase [Thermoanaerobaculia bacterium]
MEQTFVLPGAELEHFLTRKRSINIFQTYVSFETFLLRVLEMANRFVPAEAVSILMDDPRHKKDDPERNALRFVATSGARASGLLGRSIRGDQGIVGHVYRENHIYLTNDPYNDPHFDSAWDKENSFVTRSIIAAPIHIERAVIGVIELINAASIDGFTETDARLLEVFADYTCLSIQNVMDAKRAQEIAQQDELTGLYNDRFFHIQLTQDILEAQKKGGDVCLLFMDLDKFKKVNDTHGHLAGSQTLREVGYLLRDLVDWPRATLARYGGDEFVIILPDAHLTASQQVAESIIEAIQTHTFLTHPFGFLKQPLNLKGAISCSIGIASFRKIVAFKPLPLEELKEDLIRYADRAMYRAKQRGHGYVELS